MELHFNDCGTEADYLYELYIGDMAYDDFYEERESLEELRSKRKRALVGKYVIVCDGIKSKKLCYLQDRKISKKGFWTNFMSNTIGFVSKEAAMNVLRTLKYNNPRLKLVDSSYNLVDVK